MTQFVPGAPLFRFLVRQPRHPGGALEEADRESVRQTTLKPDLLANRFRPAPSVLWSAATDPAVLLDVDRGLYYALNEVAGRTWALLAAGEPVIEVLRCLRDEYEVEREVLEAELSALLRHLVDAGLIERVSP